MENAELSTIEDIILGNLFFNFEFLERSHPYLKVEYFGSSPQKKLYAAISESYEKYKVLPNAVVVATEISQNNPKEITEEVIKILKKLKLNWDTEQEKPHIDKLLDLTEGWVKKMAIEIALYKSVEAVQQPHSKKVIDVSTIPQLMQDALAVGFTCDVGHDYFDDVDTRYEKYHSIENKIEFDLEYINKITKGGAAEKTLTILMSGPGVGKSLCMCHFASSFFKSGRKVLYITMEMSEIRISERIDANVLDVPIDLLPALTKQEFRRRLDLLKPTGGKLVVKEYPTGSANANHFRALLNELKTKKEFTPEIIIIDYLNICSSSRLSGSARSDLYGYIKSIAEEIRGLAVETGIPIISATQVNRTGAKSSDFDMADTAESWGLPATVDYMWALISNDEFKSQGKILFKQLKNRYGDLGKDKKFLIGVDYEKMRLYDVDQGAQDDIVASPTKNEYKSVQREKPKFWGENKSDGRQVIKFSGVNRIVGADEL